MRMLHKNTVPFHYANVSSLEELKDEYGNSTGEYDVIYSEPIECRGCISPAKRYIDREQFGIHADYDKAIVLSSRPSGMSEDSVVWVDSSVDSGYDYIIRRISEWKNSCVVYIKKVDVTKAGVTGGE